ncbi:rod shape-determining protein MreD [Candidatus Pantoea edessiphila]|uniref:Rod shape-determining protein MreD n=2 Tax=Candidatus Pantoea edessiphila TaxID=2044610 RepID=A0A2P5T1Z8_9GAMM|nr:rod shape-determining protein MreD [Candidatus Pantoea edessiphila]
MPWPQTIYISRPSWLLLFLIYWISALPKYANNIYIGFLLGIIMDITTGSLLGIGALALSIIAYLINFNIQLINGLNMLQKLCIVVLLSILMNLIIFLIEFLIIGVPLKYELISNSMINAMIWPIFVFLIKRYCY